MHYMSPPDLQTLQLYLAVYDLGQVTNAAEHHGISASSVTKRLQDLEEYYAVALFTRHARGMVPTPAGDELARQARELVARVNTIQGIMSEFVEGVRGVVRVHASTSIIVERLADAIAGFIRENPLIRIKLREKMSASIVQDVFNGHADIGLVAARVEIPPELTVYPYTTDELMVVVPQDHPLAEREMLDFEEVLDHDHIGVGDLSSLTVLLSQEAERLNRAIRHGYRVETTEAARRMVAAGLGLAILPAGMMVPFQQTAGVRAIPLSDAWAHRDKRICVRDPSSLPASARLFLTHIRQ
jgi:DNA-binding transcriptional LysR family regulator